MFKYGTSELAPSANPPSLPLVPESLEDWKGELFLKAMDLDGCRSLCRILQHRKPEDIQLAFSELKDHICSLMFDRFGGSVILCLSEVCDEQQMNQLVSSLTADARLLMLVCLNPNGSDIMQKLIGILGQKQNYAIIGFFSYLAIPLANHPSGSQVIAQCYKMFPVKETEPIVKTIADYCLELAVDQNGSEILKILISSDERAIIARSSVVQHLIGLEKRYLMRHIVDEMQGLFTYLSYHKYGTNVIKKLIGASRAKYAPQIISEIIEDPHLLAVLADPNGFSLLESAKKYAKGTDLKTLDDLIRQHSQLLKKELKRNRDMRQALALV
ncbi:pumilio homolog 12-like isoform X2 [Henckelia pumila]|uniref:pumilio homolog 12-like isoform X2 n=1 Tax=Henckelia pumila TaxID=405737 RepID=UPI003C6E21FD